MTYRTRSSRAAMVFGLNIYMRSTSARDSRISASGPTEDLMAVLRDTDYATELARAVLTFPSGDEARIERLFVKSQNQIEIRMSWWKDGKLQPRPLDLGEA